MRTPFEDDEDGAGGNTSFNSSSGPAMTQYGGFYASENGPGGYDQERHGGYDPYAAAAAGGVGAAAVGAHAYHPDDPYQDFASNQNQNPSQYYLDPNEYDYDKASRSDLGGHAYESGPYSDVPLVGGGHRADYVLSRQDSEGSVGDHARESYNNRGGPLKVGCDLLSPRGRDL
jgi:hypothetical protein